MKNKIKLFAQQAAKMNLNFATKGEYEAFEALYNTHATNKAKLARGELANEDYLQVLLHEFAEIIEKRKEISSILHFIAIDYAELQKSLRNNAANDNN